MHMTSFLEVSGSSGESQLTLLFFRMKVRMTTFSCALKITKKEPLIQQFRAKQENKLRFVKMGFAVLLKVKKS